MREVISDGLKSKIGVEHRVLLSYNCDDMSVNVGPNDCQSVQVEVRVPGTDVDVWCAIAIGPGISSWFVPTDFYVGPDGIPDKVVCHFGVDMDAVAVVTEWEPPRRFNGVSSGWSEHRTFNPGVQGSNL